MQLVNLAESQHIQHRTETNFRQLGWQWFTYWEEASGSPQKTVPYLAESFRKNEWYQGCFSVIIQYNRRGVLGDSHWTTVWTVISESLLLVLVDLRVRQNLRSWSKIERQLIRFEGSRRLMSSESHGMFPRCREGRVLEKDRRDDIKEEPNQKHFKNDALCPSIVYKLILRLHEALVGVMPECPAFAVKCWTFKMHTNITCVINPNDGLGLLGQGKCKVKKIHVLSKNIGTTGNRCGNGKSETTVALRVDI